SEITKLKTPKGNVYYDITSSAITSGTGMHDEPNTLRVPNSMFGVRNFALFKVSGNLKNRKLSMTFIDTNGKELYNYEFKDE
ncbi:MAG: alkaline phosphatase family protein, partial [Saprospiraceae bacterium]